MRKLLCVMVAVLLSISMIFVNATELDIPVDEEMSEDYSYTYDVTSALSITSKKATCKSFINGVKSVTKIVISQKLQKKVNGEWTNVKTWSKTVSSHFATFTNTKSSLSSGTYQTRTVAKVYKNSNYETVSTNSTSVKI